MQQVLRVATFNNFNFTTPEFLQLDEILDRYPEYDVFVNSNSKAKVRGGYRAFLCVNPDLNEFIEPRGDLELIKAVRVKYVADAKPVVGKAFNKCVKWAYKHEIPILITYMRFRKRETLQRFTKGNPGYYSWQKNYFRQTIRKTFDLDLFHYCDIMEKGCPSCKNCAKIPFGYKDADIFSLNLSSSGSCPYNCPDCYVQTFKWVKISYDKILQNTKQLGHKGYQLGYGKDQLSFEDWMKKEAGKENIIDVGF